MIYNLLFTNLVRLINFIPRKENRILLIKPDNIGDYIIFRNFIDSLILSTEFKEKEWIFIGNISYKSVFDAFDSNLFQSAIWINSKDFRTNNYLKRIKILIKIIYHLPSQAIIPVHSSNSKMEDLISDLSLHKVFIPSGDNINDSEVLIHRTKRRNYIEIPSFDYKTFEFDRNKFFVENLIGQKISIDLPYLKLDKPTVIKSQVIVVIGANEDSKLWHVNNYVKIVNLLELSFPNKFKFIFTGTKNEVELFSARNEDLDASVNFELAFGNLSLVQLIEMISESFLVISNETGTIHITSALSRPYVCVSNGAKFGRFSPYPYIKSTVKSYTLFPFDYQSLSETEIEFLKEENKVSAKHCIDTITVDRVFNVTKELLEDELLNNHSL